jgi:NADP-dependent 3-hydroxy acid dehydrogenase YdfG
MLENIKEKIVVITGASSGLGEATARLLARQGASVVLGARRTEQLEKISSEINLAGGKAIFHDVDVTDASQVKDFVKFAYDQYGRIDVMINNAGIMPVSPFEGFKNQRMGPDGRHQYQGCAVWHCRCIALF